ncbi:MAG TPA: lipoprotein-releasing ABC transporter permease subunit [Syntrophales bacterium]|nr:lipoprotein-releasing ABC transporter permease subunit [Syntrophales bacterium]
MSYEFFISLRYLRAKRKQVFVSIITFISMAGILLGVAALIIVLAVMNGFEKELRDKILGINAHIILMEYTGPMKDYERVKRDISAVPGVVASAPFIYTQAMLKNGDSVSGIVLRGLSPTDARDVINLGRMVEGRLENLSVQGREGMQMPKPLADVPGIVLGKELARHIGAYLYDTVHVVSPQGIATPMGMVPRMKKFVVVGIFESGFYEYDSTLAYLSLADSQDFLGLGDQVTGLEIKVDNIYNARDIAGAIEQKLGYPFWARDWMKMNRNLFAALRLEKRVMFIIVGLIVLVAGFNIICTLIMVVMEKTKDIAILKSMGATSKSIMKIFMLQGVIIGGIGTLLGTVLGLTVAWNIGPITRSIENLFGFKILPGDVYYLSELPALVNYEDVAIILVGSVLISLIATLYPSRNASRLDPAEAIRYE